MKKTNLVTMTFQATPELRERIKQAAESGYRSTSAFIRFFFEKHLMDEQELPMCDNDKECK